MVFGGVHLLLYCTRPGCHLRICMPLPIKGRTCVRERARMYSTLVTITHSTEPRDTVLYTSSTQNSPRQKGDTRGIITSRCVAVRLLRIRLSLFFFLPCLPLHPLFLSPTQCDACQSVTLRIECGLCSASASAQAQAFRAPFRSARRAAPRHSRGSDMDPLCSGLCMYILEYVYICTYVCIYIHM